MDDHRVDGTELAELTELGSDDRLLRGLLLKFAVSTRNDDDSGDAPGSGAYGPMFGDPA
jgi:hypothetical protein